MGFLRTSVTACIMNNITFSAPFGIFYVRMEFEKNFFKKSPIQPPNRAFLIFKLPFPNGTLPQWGLQSTLGINALKAKFIVSVIFISEYFNELNSFRDIKHFHDRKSFFRSIS